MPRITRREALQSLLVLASTAMPGATRARHWRAITTRRLIRVRGRRGRRAASRPGSREESSSVRTPRAARPHRPRRHSSRITVFRPARRAARRTAAAARRRLSARRRRQGRLRDGALARGARVRGLRAVLSAARRWLDGGTGRTAAGCAARHAHDPRARRDRAPTPRTHGVIGFSAGGHLAAPLAHASPRRPTSPTTQSTRVRATRRATALIYPVITMGRGVARWLPRAAAGTRTDPARCERTRPERWTGHAADVHPARGRRPRPSRSKWPGWRRHCGPRAYR